ncbi:MULTISPECIES: hypothetical protein [unclassified Synechococcus]|uniref:hypothetical protein n=1 Tax=unclassified Synechococcus TaxID=2626047 RepID=UPI0023B396C3|nr:MAG: Uncharacterised protein [Cyanobium sp. ARS6]
MPHSLAQLIRSISQASVLLTAGLGLAAQARPAVSVPIECRQQHQEWQNCRYESDQPGSSWQLAFEDHVVRFNHDGSGHMKMQLNDNGDWTGVQARWIAERTLCWNDVCARGEIPLD